MIGLDRESRDRNIALRFAERNPQPLGTRGPKHPLRAQHIDARGTRGPGPARNVEYSRAMNARATRSATCFACLPDTASISSTACTFSMTRPARSPARSTAGNISATNRDYYDSLH